MIHHLIGASLVIGAMYCSSTISGQTPTPTSSLRPGEVPKWIQDYKVPLPKEGLVPDKETAIKIAEVVLFRLYGTSPSQADRRNLAPRALGEGESRQSYTFGVHPSAKPGIRP